jgi:hypothetical protein
VPDAEQVTAPQTTGRRAPTERHAAAQAAWRVTWDLLIEKAARRIAAQDQANA